MTPPSLPPYWRVPDTVADLFAEADAHNPCPPYDYAHAGDFTGPSAFTRAVGWFLAVVVAASSFFGAYLVVRIVVRIAQAVAS